MCVTCDSLAPTCNFIRFPKDWVWGACVEVWVDDDPDPHPESQILDYPRRRVDLRPTPTERSGAPLKPPKQGRSTTTGMSDPPHPEHHIRLAWRGMTPSPPPSHVRLADETQQLQVASPPRELWFCTGAADPSDSEVLFFALIVLTGECSYSR